MKNELPVVRIVGHKNPDTDSVCAAIAYAALKQRTDPAHRYIPCRAGKINDETAFVLNRFGMKVPALLESVALQVADMQIQTTDPVKPSASLRTAWSILHNQRISTLPVAENGRLTGLISVNDIAMANMDIFDNDILGKAHTPWQNIADTLGATVLVPGVGDTAPQGRIRIAAGGPETLSQYLSPGDIVVLANREDTQHSAIAGGAACIIVCTGAPVTPDILEAARNAGCAVFSTRYDSFITARLISHSTPVSYFMRSDGLVTFYLDDSADEAREVMAGVRHRDFPVLDSKGEYRGMVSRNSFLSMRRKQIILVDHNEKGQAVAGLEEGEILEIIDHHRLGNIETMAPLLFRGEPLGSTCTILAQMYDEAGVTPEPAMAGILCAAILSDTLMLRSPTSTAEDKAAIERLAHIAGIDYEAFATEMFMAGGNLMQKTDDELLQLDYKEFEAGTYRFAIGQVNSLSRSELDKVKARMAAHIHKARADKGLNAMFFMLTDILKGSSELLYCGEEAGGVVTAAFGAGQNGCVSLPGVVSRKKQLVPPLMQAINSL